jgi:hypothetical protein
MAGEIEIKLKGLRDVRQELKVLQFELSQATDPEQMAELSQRAGELRDNLKRANEQAAVFAAGSPFEQTNNALGLMSSQIMSLDFEGAAESAKLFATAAKGINGQLIATQLKSLGSVVLSVGKAFLSMGAALLTNPIFLIAAAIIGIVTVIGVLLNKLGLLKPILNAVGAAFKVVKDIIMGVVQAIKDFLDWLGLTSFAAEEAADKQAKAQEKVAKSYADKQKKITTAYDQEIALAQIAGESTFELERKKQNAIIETSRQQYKALEAQRDALRASGTLTAEQSKQINETMRSLREGIQSARFEIKKLNAQEVQDTKKKNEDVEKANRESYKKRLEDDKKYRNDRIAALRILRDLELEILQDGIQKDLAFNKEKYKRLIEDTEKNENLLDNEKKRLVKELRLAEQIAEDKINKQYSDAEKNRVLAEKKFLEDAQNASLALIEQYQEEAFQLTLTDSQREILSLEDKYATRISLAKQFGEDVTAIEEAYRKEKEELDKKQALKEIELAKTKRDAIIDLTASTFEGLSAIGELFINDSKKLERFQKAQTLVQIGIDTAKAISALVAASQANPLNATTAGFAGVAQFASGIAQILTNMAKAKQLLTSPNASASGGGGGGGAATASAVPSVAPQVNLFGQGNNMNTFGQPQAQEQQSIVVQAVVSETEITGVQNKINNMQKLAEL